MRSVFSEDQDLIEQQFVSSIFQHTHFGWLDLRQLPGNCGDIFADDRTLIALQHANPHLHWLHSFYSTIDPKDCDLTLKLKQCLPVGKHSIFSISGAPWYTRLLENSGFTICDEIIQFTANPIRIPDSEAADEHITTLLPEQWDSVKRNCESAFPPIWQLNDQEFEGACTDADYSLICCRSGEAVGYLLGDLDQSSCHILRLAVAPAYQHHGIAHALAVRMVRDCASRGISEFSVNTNKKNSAAVNFYSRLNFKLIDERFPVFYRFLSVGAQRSGI